MIRTLPLVLGLLIAAPSIAQKEPAKYEFTPFASYLVGGSFEEKNGDGRVTLNDSNAAGFTLNIQAHPKGQYELLYSRQRTGVDTRGLFPNNPAFDMDVEYLQFGGLYLFDGDSLRPFISLTLGMTQVDADFAGTESERFLSTSFGGGLKIRAGETLGLRLEARLFTTFVDEDSGIFCSSIGGAAACLIQASTRSLSQWEARAGLVFRF